jgi:hypothetical protein
VQLGMVFLFPSILGVMASIGPELDSPWFGISLAGFGAGLGLSVSQLGNVVMSSIPESRSSEGGGVQGVAQNLGQSLGTALIGAVLLAELTTGFHNQVQASSLPDRVKTEVVTKTEEGLAMVSADQAEQIARDNGLSKRATDDLVSLYSDSQITALKIALLTAALFVLVGAWFARSLPSRPLTGPEEDDARAGPGVRAPPEDTGAPGGLPVVPA